MSPLKVTRRLSFFVNMSPVGSGRNVHEIPVAHDAIVTYQNDYGHEEGHAGTVAIADRTGIVIHETELNIDDVVILREEKSHVVRVVRGVER